MTRRKLPQLELSVEEITPAIALEWLEKNTFNRKMSDRLVDIYAEAILGGEWRLNGEPIIFDFNGRLQSGQHRLQAVIVAKTSIWSVVVRGAEPDSLYTLDSGRKRRMTDLLTLQGEKDVAVLANLLVWTWRWENQLMDRSISPTNTHLLTILADHPELRDYVKLGNRFRRSGIRVQAGLIGALFYQFDLINRPESDAFFDQLVTGEGLTSDQPAYAWRRWVFRSMSEPGRMHGPTLAAITVKAWNEYRGHQTVKAFRWAANEAFPEAI